MKLIDAAARLRDTTGKLRFGDPVAYVYHPLDYAWTPHEMYLRKWGAGTKGVLLLGMNPGPFGMAQTGVPFGDPELVRGFLKIEGQVEKPTREHPKRPVLGFSSKRSEVSGHRLWGWAQARFGTAATFFDRFFVANYCPLAFLDEGARNVTPDKLDRDTQRRLEETCDEALRATVDALGPKYVIGIGEYATKQARRALEDRDVSFGTVLHPSPASPAANRGWAQQAEKQFRELGIRLP